jgi:hypothetical protein
MTSCTIVRVIQLEQRTEICDKSTLTSYSVFDFVKEKQRKAER